MPSKVQVFTKDGCHLCEAVLSVVRESTASGLVLDVVDIAREPGTYDRYLLRVPVVTIDGKEVFEAKDMDPGRVWKNRLVLMLRPSG